MYYFNSVVRTHARYDHGIPLKTVPGLTDGYDSAAEARIWRKYLGAGAKPKDIADMFRRASRAPMRGLTGGPRKERDT